MAKDESGMASVAGRYASALFDLAKDGNQVPDVEAGLAKFEGLLSESSDLRRMVLSPVISAEDQGKALTALMAKAGISGITANFLKLLARNRRLFAAPDTIATFRALAAKARGEVVAEVTSAQALNESQLTALKDTLKASVGKDVRLATKVDPSLLGGLIVKVGSHMVDSSLKTKLAAMKVAMKGTA